MNYILISEEEARQQPEKVRQGQVDFETRKLLGPPTGYPRAFLRSEDGDIYAFHIYQARDVLPGWEDARKWTGYTPPWL